MPSRHLRLVLLVLLLLLRGRLLVPTTGATFSPIEPRSLAPFLGKRSRICVCGARFALMDISYMRDRCDRVRNQVQAL